MPPLAASCGCCAMRIGGGRSRARRTLYALANKWPAITCNLPYIHRYSPSPPSTRRLSFSWLFSALSFHPGAIHRLPGNCQRSAPRNAGVAGQQRGPRAPRKCVNLCISAERDNREGGVGISLPGKARNISVDISTDDYTRPLLTS